ncbi:hypothetical protein ACFSX5_01005 [Devosia albogilva]|uniref:Uncharacterized protein n=1 Tax=Devosia albogilva TaxID=429726 RepID=A0ABW5QEY4_9HYPH
MTILPAEAAECIFRCMHRLDDRVDASGAVATDPRQDLSPAELDRLIKHYRCLLQSHRWEVRVGSAEMAGHALTAIEDIRALLGELAVVATPDQRAKIEAILEHERQRSPNSSPD